MLHLIAFRELVYNSNKCHIMGAARERRFINIFALKHGVCSRAAFNRRNTIAYSKMFSASFWLVQNFNAANFKCSATIFLYVALRMFERIC